MRLFTDEIIGNLLEPSLETAIIDGTGWNNHGPGSDDVIIVPTVSDEDAKANYPGGFQTVKPYPRTVAQPREEPAAIHIERDPPWPDFIQG